MPLPGTDCYLLQVKQPETAASGHSLAEIYPVLGLRIRAGEHLELTGMDDATLVALAEVAVSGIHDPSWSPFYQDWTAFEPDILRRNFLQHHWGVRAEFGPSKWTLDLAVWWDGELVGAQGISTEHYLVTRTGETGSWLGRAHQGKGIGTLMRRAFCAFMFDHLEARTVSSAAFVDNAPSLAVSRKVGYRPNGMAVKVRRGVAADNQQLLLLPTDLHRGGLELEVTGASGVRELIGLDSH